MEIKIQFKIAKKHLMAFFWKAVKHPLIVYDRLLSLSIFAEYSRSASDSRDDSVEYIANCSVLGCLVCVSTKKITVRYKNTTKAVGAHIQHNLSRDNINIYAIVRWMFHVVLRLTQAIAHIK